VREEVGDWARTTSDGVAVRNKMTIKCDFIDSVII
jgi:hypothetical protein